MATKYLPKIERLLGCAVEFGFTEQDFAELCIAATDQAGSGKREQRKIQELLPEFEEV